MENPCSWFIPEAIWPALRALFQIRTSSICPWKKPVGVNVVLVLRDVPIEVMT